MTSRCPTCGRPADPTARHRPFCSERCRLVDLDRWLSEDYRVPGDPIPDPDDPPARDRDDAG